MRGGKRSGAGRPRGSGKFQESTRPIRVPCGLLSEVEELINKYKKISSLPNNVVPLFSNKVAAGMPSPVEDHLEENIDLSQYLIKNPRSTFLVRVQGESMINVGIFPDDLLLVDSSIKPEHGKIVVAVVDGELTVKRLHINKREVLLLAENPIFQAIKITEDTAFSISGVVTNVIHGLY